MNVYWPSFLAANDVPCSQGLTAEHHSALTELAPEAAILPVVLNVSG